MAAVPPSADQASELLQNLSLDANPKPVVIPDHSKKSTGNQIGSVNAGNGPNGQMQPYERSLTPVLPDFRDPAFYVPNGFSSAPFYYGGVGQDWDEYSRYSNPEGVDMNSGFFGDTGSLIYHGYGYPPYGPYSPATSPVPTSDQLYGTQHYHYPSPYFQSLTPTSTPFSPSPVGPTGEVTNSATSDQKPLAVDAVTTNSNGAVNALKGNSWSTHSKSSNQNTIYNSKASSHGGVVSGYQDPRFGFDSMLSPVPWLEAAVFADAPVGPMSSATIANQYPNSSNVNSRNQHFRSNSNYVGLPHSRSVSGVGATGGFANRMYPDKLYDHYGRSFRSGMGLGSHGFDTRSGGRAWLTTDKYKNRGQGYYGYNNDSVDGLNELNRGPRAKDTKNEKSSTPAVSAKFQSLPSNGTIQEGESKGCVVPEINQYNKVDFPEEYTDAKFFVIKSYSEDDVHKSIKYNVWASTPSGNKKLDAAYREAQEKPSGCPVFLFFSVNASGQFVGLAEMVGPVDFQKNVKYWQQDKWNGQFPVKWHIVKDVPNSLLKYITLENNENKPVTNSRDTQEVMLAQGLKMIKIFKEHTIKTCLLDDFDFYENRQKLVQEKKAMQLHLQKQVSEGTSPDEKGVTDAVLKFQKPLEETMGIKSNGDFGEVLADGTSAKVVEGPTATNAVVSEKPAVGNGAANAC
ncbi:hypothetical protein MLD38_003375 [Melastoma candidum]|uniref:Uncharacterized protein n=1 Tax=Melastoma candidum TaxID=119954 RepID=A0ACB9S1W0_9MYRT|nr:hypothetical protein MLD38_003375 [Melastoma candidum]